MQLSEDLQLIEMTKTILEMRKKDISRDDQQAYYLLAFQILY